jgi:hypothetical protein
VSNFGTAKLADVKLKITLEDKAADLNIGEMNVSGKKQLKTFFDIRNWKPGTYSVSAELTGNGQSLDTESASFTVPPIKNVTSGQTVQVTPWSKTVILDAQNFGNIPSDTELTAQVQQSMMVSISYSQPPTARGDLWTWTANLQPGESLTVQYTEFYWPVPIIIILAVLGGVYAYLFVTSIGMKKIVVKHGEDWSANITIVNRGQAVEGVVVRDIIPHHLNLSGTFETLKPIARKTDVGTELIWRVGGIKRGEQKVLHYKMAARAPFRTLRLPSARLRATKKDKVVLSSSNTVTLEGDKAPPKLHVEQ